MNTHHRSAFAGVAIAVSLASCAHVTSGARTKQMTDAMRQAAIRRANVWAPTDVASMDLRVGPRGPGAFAPGETVSCSYVEKKMSGRSPKFTCLKAPKDELKVKFGRDNGEVYAEVAASFPTQRKLDEALGVERYKREDLPWDAAFNAARAFLSYRRAGGLKRSPLPDFYIGAHADLRGYYLLTRDASRYRQAFPALKIISPETHP